MEKGCDICSSKSEGEEDLVELLDDDHGVEGEGPMDGPETDGDAKNHHIDISKDDQDDAHVGGDHLPAGGFGEHEAADDPAVEETR